LNIGSSRYLRDTGPLDPDCGCPVCLRHSLGYICHLYRAHEMAACTLLTLHNLAYFNRLVARVREKVRDGYL
ncbi:tRNA-guanine transglycosylase, partial [Patescibacteria group bacterium]